MHTETQSAPSAEPKKTEPPNDPEPRWLAFVALLTVGGVWLALPPALSLGPVWLLLAIIAMLEIPILITHHRGYELANRILGHIVSAVTTLFMLFSVVMLIRAIANHSEPPLALLGSGAALWVTNVIVFASWYWRLDAGGPHGREKRPGHTEGSVCFPQMMLDQPARDRGGRLWSPNFVDYLFLAFNTSTAFSPTDAPVLSRWAKVLMMLQSIISLTIVLLLFGRAVNIM